MKTCTYHATSSQATALGMLVRCRLRSLCLHCARSNFNQNHTANTNKTNPRGEGGERQTDRQRQKQRQTDRDTQRDRQTNRDRDRQRDRQRQREKQKQIETERECVSVWKKEKGGRGGGEGTLLGL